MLREEFSELMIQVLREDFIDNGFSGFSVEKSYPFCSGDLDECGCSLCLLLAGEVDSAFLLDGSVITRDDVSEPPLAKPIPSEVVGYWNLINCFRECPRITEFVEGWVKQTYCGCDYCRFDTKAIDEFETITGISYSRDCCDC